MTNCKECYHLIKREDGSNFCFAEGFISENEPPLNQCPYFLNKHEPLKPCPNCQDIHRKKTDFCKHCKILTELNLYERAVSKSIKIGIYSLNDMDEMIKELHFIEKKISIELDKSLERTRYNILSVIEGNHKYQSMKEEFEFLRKEISIIEDILDIDEIMNDAITSIKPLIHKKGENLLDEDFLKKIELLNKENRLSNKIADLDEKISLLIQKTKFIGMENLLNDLKEIGNHIQKMEKYSEIKRI